MRHQSFPSAIASSATTLVATPLRVFVTTIGVILCLFASPLAAEDLGGAERSSTPSTATGTPPLHLAEQLSMAFGSAASRITPSVVNVSSSKKASRGPRTLSRRDPFFDQFREFFGDDFPGQMPDDSEGPTQQGLGTGVIVDAKGLILTNHHVVGDADEVTVRLQDGRKLKAQIVGKDERSDLAVIKVKGDNFVPAKLGNSDKLNIGEWVVAAGNPFGLDNTITAGIVSAKGRSIIGGGQFEDFIQTDAAINPGNSGGPLVNLEGEVVGINTAIFSRSGGYMGIGFAIPINMARTVMESLINNGKVVRGWLGVGIQNLTEGLARNLKAPTTDGALVGHIDPKGPASSSGLRQGDIIVALNGSKLKDINQLRNQIAMMKPGSSATLDILRDGRKDSVTVKIGELPAQGGSPRDSVEEETEQDVSIGATITDLTPEIARKLRSTRTSGAVIAAVQPGSLAASGGLQPMDILISVDGKPVNSASEFRSLIRRADIKAGVRLVVETQGMERFVFLQADGEE